MHIHRLLLSVTIAVVAALVPAAAAAADTADTYPPPPSALTVSATTVTVGDAAIVEGSCAAADSVSIAVRDELAARLSTDGSGRFQASVEMTQVGQSVITATCASSGAARSAVVAVQPPGAALPAAGISQAERTVFILGMSALLAGILLLGALILIHRRSGARRPD